MGVICSHVGAVRVVPDSLGRMGGSHSLKRRSQMSNKRLLSVRRSAGDGSAMLRVGDVLDIQMDACLLPLTKASQNLNIEIFKHPIIVVTITVDAVDKTKLNVINDAIIDWGNLVLVNQVPKCLPKSMRPGSYVIHAVLAKSSVAKENITFRGHINGKTVEYNTGIEDDAPYLSNPVALAETLMVFQNQLQAEDQSQHRRVRASKGEVATATGSRGYMFQNLPEQDEGETSDTGMVTKQPSTSRQMVSKRKNTPFATALPKSVNVSLRSMMEAMSFREEDEGEETGDELPSAWHMSRRMSGRMSRMSRRFSVQSIGRESLSSLFVNPPGAGHRSRLSRRRSHSSRWNERSSVIEYRQRPGEVSDFETSASESDHFNSSICGANMSESSYTWSEPRPLEELIALTSWSPLGPGSGDRKQVSSEEKLTPEERDKSGRMRKQFEPAHDASSGNLSSVEVMTSKRQRRATPRSIKMVRKQSLPLRSPVHVIREEEGFDEGTVTDGHVSSQDPVSTRRKMSSLRKKRHFRSTLSATDLIRRMEFYNSSSTSPSNQDNEAATNSTQTSVKERQCVKEEMVVAHSVEVSLQKEEVTHGHEEEVTPGKDNLSRQQEEGGEEEKQDEEKRTSQDGMQAQKDQEELDVVQEEAATLGEELHAQKEKQLARK